MPVAPTTDDDDEEEADEDPSAPGAAASMTDRATAATAAEADADTRPIGLSDASGDSWRSAMRIRRQRERT
jgi:hypothetical protein